MTTRPTSAGDSVPPVCRIIEVRVAELRQLFNAIDPSPFNQRDLDPKAEEFIVGWSADLPGDAALALVVHLDRAAGMADEAIALRNAIDYGEIRSFDVTKRSQLLHKCVQRRIGSKARI